VPLLDVHFFVSAVLLQKRTGGNLAETSRQAGLHHPRALQAARKIRAISAHGRMTVRADHDPGSRGRMLFWVNPDYVRFFFTDSPAR